jgi:predicted CxxxxCH...CXXCH cytochrome family protein
MKSKKSLRSYQKFSVMLSVSVAALLISANVSFAALSCNSCHGTSGDIRPVDTTDTTSFRNITTGGFAGNHRTHMSVTTNPASCIPCHNNSGYTSSHRTGKINFNSNINSSVGVGKYEKVTGFQSFTASQVPNPTLGTCATVNCHFESRTPIWGTSKTLTNCDTCHASQPTTFSHTKHLSTTTFNKATCSTCHPVRTTFSHATSVSRPLELNTSMNYAGSNNRFLPSQTGRVVGNCTTYCHSSGQSATGTTITAGDYRNVTWGATLTCNGCHNVTVGTLTTGSHTKHLNAVGSAGCGDCHVGATTTSYASNRHVDGFMNVTGAYSQGKSSSMANGYGTCSTTACHDNGTGTKVPSQKWGTVVAACTTCHALQPTTGNHTKHITGTSFSKANCASCHNGAVEGTTANTDHLDGNIDVYKTTKGDLGYSSDKAKGSSYASCTTYCHSSGQSATGTTITAGDYRSVTWGSGVLSCNGCHNVTAATLTSGSHAKHLNAVGSTGCGDCHVGATLATYASTRHVDGFINVTGAYTQGKSSAPGNGYGSCSTTSCHDNGTGNKVATANWGTSVTQCTACHALQPATASHGKHLTGWTGRYYAAGSGAVCADCHNGAVQGGVANVGHLNGSVDVFKTTAGDLGYPANKPKGSAYQSCSLTYCHSNGKGSYQSVLWGSSVLNCTSCHPTLGGAHTRHAGGLTISSLPFYQYTSNKSAGSDAATAANFAFGCANCHPVDSMKHLNGTIEVELNNIAGVSSLRAKNSAVANQVNGSVGTNVVTCASVYCHSDGKGGQTTTLQWGQNYSAVDRCAQCHGNSPTGTGAHASHVIGIHADDIYNGTSGKLSAGSTGSVSHGIAAQVTTINCDTCHNATVTYARNKNNSACSTALCHPTSTDTASTQNARVTDISRHVNGQVEIKFLSTTFKSKAQLRDVSFVNYTGGTAGWTRNLNQYKTGATAFDVSKNPLEGTIVWNKTNQSCANVVCHNMKAATPAVKWTDTLTCDSCHPNL